MLPCSPSSHSRHALLRPRARLDVAISEVHLLHSSQQHTEREAYYWEVGEKQTARRAEGDSHTHQLEPLHHRQPPAMGFSFGNFDKICETAALIPCAMLADNTGTGIEPVCYARNVEINGTILFQPGELDWFSLGLHSPKQRELQGKRVIVIASLPLEATE